MFNILVYTHRWCKSCTLCRNTSALLPCPVSRYMDVRVHGAIIHYTYVPYTAVYIPAYRMQGFLDLFKIRDKKSTDAFSPVPFTLYYLLIASLKSSYTLILFLSSLPLIHKALIHNLYNLLLLHMVQYILSF